ncbi:MULTISPECIES: hypothetical protein [unclassified Blastococcus]
MPTRLPRRRTTAGRAVPLLAVPLLALAACGADPPEVDVTAGVVVTVPGDPATGDLYQPTAVTVAEDGTRTVLLRGTDRVGLTAVSADGEVVGAVTLPGLGELYTVVRTAAGEVAVGWVDGDPGGSVVLVPVDPAAGTAGPAVPVETPAQGQVLPDLVQAVALPDSRVVVALSRVGDGPQAPLLMLVDVATAAVVATAELDLGEAADGAQLLDLADLAVDADGTRIAVGVVAFSPEWEGIAGGFRAVLATVGPDLRPDGPAVDLVPDAGSAQVEAVAVDADGTVYAVAAAGTDLDARLVAVEPGATGAEVRADPDEDRLEGQAADLVIAGGAAWVLHAAPGDGDDTSLSRVGLADGEATAPLGLCDGSAGALAVAPGGGLVAVGECGSEAELWVLEPR